MATSTIADRESLYYTLLTFLDGHPEQVEFREASIRYLPKSGHDIVLRLTCTPKGEGGEDRPRVYDIPISLARQRGLYALAGNPSAERAKATITDSVLDLFEIRQMGRS